MIDERTSEGRNLDEEKTMKDETSILIVHHIQPDEIGRTYKLEKIKEMRRKM